MAKLIYTALTSLDGKVAKLKGFSSVRRTCLATGGRLMSLKARLMSGFRPK
jgi:hypothetical protein